MPVPPNVLADAVHLLRAADPDLDPSEAERVALLALSAAYGSAPTLAERRATEDALGEPHRTRERFLRIVTCAGEALELYGLDSSLILDPEELTVSESALLRAHRATHPAVPVSEGCLKELLDEMSFWEDHHEELEEELLGPTGLDLWNDPDWPVRARRLLPFLLSGVLHPAQLSLAEWSEFMALDEDVLEALQKYFLEMVSEEDLAEFGIQRAVEGWSGLEV